MLSNFKLQINQLSNHDVGRDRSHQGKFNKVRNTQVALKSYFDSKGCVRTTSQTFISSFQELETTRKNECNRMQDPSTEKGKTLWNNPERKRTAG